MKSLPFKRDVEKRDGGREGGKLHGHSWVAVKRKNLTYCQFHVPDHSMNHVVVYPNVILQIMSDETTARSPYAARIQGERQLWPLPRIFIKR